MKICKVDAKETPPQLIYLSSEHSKYPESRWIHVDIRDMQIFSDSSGNDSLFLANDGGISWGAPFKDSHGNISDTLWYWEHPCASIENGLNVTEFYGIGLCGSEPDLVAGGCQDLPEMLDDNGKWVNFGVGDGSELIWNKSNKNIFYFSEWQYGYLYRTNNLGAGSDKFFDMAKEGLFVPLELDPRDFSVLYLGLYKVYKFTGVNDFSGQVSHQTLWDFPYGISDVEAVKAYVNARCLYVSTLKTYDSSVSGYTECIYKSENNGSHFSDISTNLTGCWNGYISDIEVDPDNKLHLWVSFALYSANTDQTKKVFTSSDGGTNWQDYSQGLPPGMTVFKIKLVPQYNFLLVKTDVGIFKRNLQDTAWFPFSSNLPEGKVLPTWK